MKTEILICRLERNLRKILVKFKEAVEDENSDLSQNKKEVLILQLYKLFSETHPHVWVDYIEDAMSYDKVKDYTYMVFLPERKQVIFIKYSEPKEFDKAELDIDEDEYFLCYVPKEVQFPEPHKNAENLKFWNELASLIFSSAAICGFDLDALLMLGEKHNMSKYLTDINRIIEELESSMGIKTKEEPLKFPAYVQGGLWAMAEERKTLQHWIEAFCDDMDLIEKGKNRNKTTYTRETLNRAFNAVEPRIRGMYIPDKKSFGNISNFDTSKDDYTSIYIPCTGFIGKKDAHQMIEEIMSKKYLKPCYRGIIGEDGELRISGIDVCEDTVTFNDTVNRAYSILNGARKVKQHTGKKNRRHRLTLTIEKLK